MSADEIKARVKKLLARAKSDNVHEAATAAAMAHQMMLEHKLSQADIEEKTPQAIGEFDAPGEFTLAWRFALLTAIAQSFYAKVLRISEPMRVKEGRRVVEKERWLGKVVGKREDVDGILYLFAYFEGEITRLCQEHHFDVLSATDEDSFRRGAVFALQRKILDQKRKFDTSSEKALVLAKRSDKEVKTFLDTQYREREVDADLGRARDVNAFFQGYNAGMKVNLPGKERRLPDQAEAEAQEKQRQATAKG